MKQLLIMALLLCAPATTWASSLGFSGAETGDLGEVEATLCNTCVHTDVVRTGTFSYGLHGNEDPGTPRLRYVFDTPSSEVYVAVWVRLRFNVGEVFLGIYNDPVIPEQGGVLFKKDSSNAGYLQMFGGFGEPSVVVPIPSTPALNFNDWTLVELRSMSGSGFDAEAEVRVNGSSLATITNGPNTLEPAYLDIPNTLISPSNELHVDDIRTQTVTWPGPGAVLGLRPNGTGNENGWDGSFSDIDDAPPDDNSFREAPKKNNQPASFLDNLADPAVVVTGVNQARVRVRAARTGGQAREHYVRWLMGGTTENGPDLGLTTAFTDYLYIPTAQPATQSDLDLLQVGMGQTDAGGQRGKVSEAYVMVDVSQ